MAITNRILSGLGPYVASRGLDFENLAGRAGIDLSRLEDPDLFVSLNAVLGLFELAAQELDDDAFGLRFAQLNPLPPFGLFHYIMFNAPTLQAALESNSRYSTLIICDYDLSFSIRDGVGTYALGAHAKTSPGRQFQDYVAMLLVARVRLLLCDRSWQPLSVAFDHAPPRNIAEFERALCPRLAFGAATASVQFDAASLAAPVPTADPVLFHDLTTVADKLIAMSPQTRRSVRDRVREYILRSLQDQRVSQEDAAEELGLSVRTLQRELTCEGTTFSQLVDDTRRATAEQLLLDTDLTLTEISFMVGFSELSAFSRASRNWFGEPASSMRKRGRHSGSDRTN